MTEEKDSFQYRWDHSSNLDKIIYWANGFLFILIIVFLIGSILRKMFF